MTEALVEKVSLVRKHRQAKLVAKGVKFSSKGKSYLVKAKKEIILSAGAFGSPQILELSGIGSPKILKENRIKVLYPNENVGENLQDHMMVPLGFEVADGQVTAEAFQDVKIFNAAFAQYIQNRTGPLSTGLCSSALLSYEQILLGPSKKKTPKGLEEALAFSRRAGHPGLAYQYELTRAKLLDPAEAVAQHIFTALGFTPSLGDNPRAYFGNTSPGSYLTLLGVIEHPFSRGSVHINSSNPFSYPRIDPNYLGAEVDLEVFADIMLHLQTIARAEPLASLLKNKGHVFQPGYFELDESNVRAHIKNTQNSEYHPCGTCSMSPRGKGGVVNERLRVYGTSNLRVVDASIFPLQVRANRKCPVTSSMAFCGSKVSGTDIGLNIVQSLVYAVAEKAADLIKEDAS